jgi:hypothetical protein
MMDWAASACSLLGVILTGKKLKICWLFFLLSNALWIAYCIPHRQWAQLSLNVVFIVLNVLGYRKWSRDACNQTPAQSTEVSHVGSDTPARPKVQARFPKGSSPFFPKCICGAPADHPDNDQCSAYPRKVRFIPPTLCLICRDPECRDNRCE